VCPESELPGRTADLARVKSAALPNISCEYEVSNLDTDCRLPDRMAQESLKSEGNSVYHPVALV
jgi:hypothetical protein